MGFFLSHSSCSIPRQRKEKKKGDTNEKNKHCTFKRRTIVNLLLPYKQAITNHLFPIRSKSLDRLSAID